MLSDSVGKLALLHLCGTFAVFSPDSAAVYRLAVDLQPSSEAFKEPFNIDQLPDESPQAFSKRQPFLLTMSIRSQIISAAGRYSLFSV